VFLHFFLSSVATQETDNNNSNSTHIQCLTKQARAATAAAATTALLPQAASAPFIPTPPLLVDCPLFEEDVAVQQPLPAVVPPRYCKSTERGSNGLLPWTGELIE